jgi:NDP-hexose-3-ketoreductase
MPDQIRIAALGCSNIADRKVLPAICQSPAFSLAYVASRSPEKASSFASKFDCKPCGYQDLLDAADVDAVYVSLPVGMHHEWGMKLAAAGKHILMEKTFTADLRQAEEVLAAAGEHGAVAMEGLSYTYHPVFQKTLELVKGGAVGAIRKLEANFGFPTLPEGDIRLVFALGGGAILDALIYPLSFCLYMAGTPALAYQAKTFRDEGAEVDSRGAVQLDWGDYSGQIGYGLGFNYRNRYSVWGESGFLDVDRAFSRPAKMKGEIIVSRQGGTETVTIEPADQFQIMVDNFAQKIRGEDPSGFNEKAEILERMGIISAIRDLHIEVYGG